MKRLIVVSTATAALAIAQFGSPIVHDPLVDLHLLAQTMKIIQEIQVLERTYETTTMAYQQIQANARMISGKSGWRYALSPLMYPTSANAYGTSAGWMGSLNTGLSAAQRYEMATIRYSSPTSLYSALSSTGQANFGAHIATMELNDGVAQNAMTVTGTARGQMAARATGLAKLQSDSLSDSPELNSEVGVLNKVNAASLIHAQAQQDTNTLLGAMVDQQTIELKVRHDAMVSELNSAMAAQAMKQQNIDALWGGDATAHHARIP